MYYRRRLSASIFRKMPPTHIPLHTLVYYPQSISYPLEILAIFAKPPVSQWLREHAIVQQLEEIPFAGATFSLEVPEDPALGLRLECVELDFDVAADAIFPVLRP